MSLIQRARAAAVIGFSWAVPWALAGVALITWRVFLGSPPLATPLHYWPRFALNIGMLGGAFGFLAGLTFALTLGKTARGRALSNLSLGYAARWGAIAGAVSIIVAPLAGVIAWPVLIVGAAAFAFVGAGSAVATLSIARRATVVPTLPGQSHSAAT